MRFRSGMAAIAAVPLLLGCLDFLAGNGSEVENAVVAGTVVDPSGEGVAGARVTLLPEGYDPLDPERKPLVTRQTNGRGAFEFRCDTGTYNIYALHHATGRNLLISKVRILGPGRWDAGSDTVRAPGKLKVSLPPGSWRGAYAYLPGTPLAVEVDAAAEAEGAVVLDSVPPGRFSVLLGRPSDSARHIAGVDVPVAPARTAALPYSEWRARANLAVDPEAAGVALSGGVASLPLLVRLDESFDYASAAPGGRDVRFTSDAGDPLPHAVQSWDAAGGRALIWVRADTVAAKGPTRLRMYWGNDTAGAAPGAVFDASEGYAAAWHFDDRPSGNPPGFPDASTAGDSAFAQGALATADTAAPTDSSAAVTRADGIAGRGVRLDGRSAYAAGARTYAGPQAFSYGFWFKTTTREGGKILGFIMPGLTGTIPGRAGNFNMDRLVWMDDDGFVRFGFTIASADTGGSIGSWQAFVSSKKYNDGQWHHLACSVFPGRALLQLDGESAVNYAGPVRPLSLSGHWRMGFVGTAMWDPVWTSEYFRGSLDEVRIIHGARSEDWLKLDHASQKPGSRLIRFE